MKYCVKMRASKWIDGKEVHVSGAERIVDESIVPLISQNLITRAQNHSKGKPTFINIKVEGIEEDKIQYIKALPTNIIEVNTYQEGLAKMCEYLKISCGISSGLSKYLVNLLAKTGNMRGAIMYDIATQSRLEADFERGIRLSNMDYENNIINIEKDHYREALVLASKALSAEGVLAEICISDDPEYQIGYIATTNSYCRITKVKPYGSSLGGRILVVDSRVADMKACQQYLEEQVVVVKER